jgi:hypothetical protein
MILVSLDVVGIIYLEWWYTSLASIVQILSVIYSFILDVYTTCHATLNSYDVARSLPVACRLRQVSCHIHRQCSILSHSTVFIFAFHISSSPHGEGQILRCFFPRNITSDWRV